MTDLQMWIPPVITVYVLGGVGFALAFGLGSWKLRVSEVWALTVGWPLLVVGWILIYLPRDFISAMRRLR